MGDRPGATILTSSRDPMVCRQEDIFLVKVDVVGDLKSSRVSSMNSATLIRAGISIHSDSISLDTH